MTNNQKTTLIALFLFLLALAVRLPGLDTFFTADEFLWVDRSRVFLGGLLDPTFLCDTGDRGLACTLRTGHPGVITMWTGVAGIITQWLTRPADDARTLLEFVNTLPVNPVERQTIAPVRLPTVILTVLFVAVFYLLLRKLFHPRAALLAGLLVALNPFHAALSRVLHHDALSTIFIVTGALSLIIYFGVDQRRRWVVLAGALGGLAMLSKSTGLFLIPYAGLLGLWRLLLVWAREEMAFAPALRRVLLDGLIWALMAMAVFVACWPAMWVIPAAALNMIFFIGFKYAEGGHAKGVFFLNDVSKDPGPLFYPVMWFFRTNFWSMLGVFAALGLGVAALRRRWISSSLPNRLKRAALALSPRRPGDQTGLLIWIGAFLFFFLIFVTLGEKKQDRYSLPLYPMLDAVAAVGLWSLVRSRRVVWQNALIGLVMAVNLVFIVITAPYYFTYYNPLVGGIKAAAQSVSIGWGEGLDLAADYLNSKPNAGRIKASAWYGSTFAPYFQGETIRYAPEQKGNALGGDYVIFYINQLQRHYPDGEIWAYVSRNFTFEKSIVLNGVEYASIYTGPGIGHYVEDQTYKGIAGLLGWDWTGAISPDAGPVPAGSDLPLDLYWEYLGKAPEEQFFIRLIGADGNAWAETVTRPAAPVPAQPWREGQIIKEAGVLSLPADMPPGEYTVQPGFYTRAPGIPNGELTYPTLESDVDEIWEVITVTSVITPASAVTGVPVGDLVLIGGGSGGIPAQSTDAPAELRFDLRWGTERGTPHTYQATFALADATGSARWTWPARPLIPFLSTEQWPAGRILRSQWVLPLADPRLPGGEFTLQLHLADETGAVETTDLGSITLPGRVRDFAPPQPQQAVNARLGEAISLVGADTPDRFPAAGSALPVTLYWQALGPVAEDYTIFIQLLGPDGQVAAQQDSRPLGGSAPTATWTPGETITDPYTLPLPADLPPGAYRLIAGMYRLETGERLSVAQDNQVSDAVLLRQW